MVATLEIVKGVYRPRFAKNDSKSVISTLDIALSKPSGISGEPVESTTRSAAQAELSMGRQLRFSIADRNFALVPKWVTP